MGADPHRSAEILRRHDIRDIDRIRDHRRTGRSDKDNTRDHPVRIARLLHHDRGDRRQHEQYDKTGYSHIDKYSAEHCDGKYDPLHSQLFCDHIGNGLSASRRSHQFAEHSSDDKYKQVAADKADVAVRIGSQGIPPVHPACQDNNERHQDGRRKDI